MTKIKNSNKADKSKYSLMSQDEKFEVSKKYNNQLYTAVMNSLN